MSKEITFSSKDGSDEELIKKFKEQNIDISKAIADMLEEADAIDAGKKSSASFNDIFGIDWFFSVL